MPMPMPMLKLMPARQRPRYRVHPARRMLSNPRSFLRPHLTSTPRHPPRGQTACPIDTEVSSLPPAPSPQ